MTRLHPGPYIRTRVIPASMEIAEAARLLGVQRPTLSNLLNGKAALSPEMAARLETTFGADSSKLLRMQADHDDERAQVTLSNIPARRNVPTYLNITATDIENWANGINPRSELAVLLRMLILSTTTGVTEIDFPGYDNAQRHGWDGRLVAGDANPWVVTGASGWEFGCDSDPAKKAREDFAQRTKSEAAPACQATTFVFVTPRNWKSKTIWAQSMEAQGHWKAVRAYDANDLEQWIQQSLPVQAWLSEKLGRPTRGLRAITQCWSEWSAATETPLPPALLTPAVERHEPAVRQWLEAPPARPLVLAADSRQEGLAFLGLMATHGSIASSGLGSRLVLIETEEALKAASTPTGGIVPVIAEPSLVERLGGLFRETHVIVIRPKNDTREAAIILEGPSDEEFLCALKEAGLDREEADALRRASGGSLTVLRRRLAVCDELRRPTWSQADDLAEALVPMALIGAWDTGRSADVQVMGILTDPEMIERMLVRMLRLDDAPVWAVGSYRGVVSKVDALFALADSIAAKTVEDFLFIAEYVLSMEDPALELPEEDRWAAGLYGKVREHSPALRRGICETLVLLSVHAEEWFPQGRLGFDVRHRIDHLIRRLLVPLDPIRLESQVRDLPRYAEAAPDAVLKIIEDDLSTAEPKVMVLLRPASSEPFGSCPRTGLLWALETVAWSPRYLERAATILARLSEKEIGDNWSNTPFRSLFALLSAAMPQTAASLAVRKRTFDLIHRRFPEVAWRLCAQELQSRSSFRSPSAKPAWRRDHVGGGGIVSQDERAAFVLHALDKALSGPWPSLPILADIVCATPVLDDFFQKRIAELVHSWARTASEAQRADLRDRIGRSGLRWRRGRGNIGGAYSLIRDLHDHLTPTDIVERHRHLFTQAWVDLDPDELDEGEFDYDARARRIASVRQEAVAAIWEVKGPEGLLALLKTSSAPHIIGASLAPLLSVEDLASVVRAFLPSRSQELDWKRAALLAGLLDYGDAAQRTAFLDRIMPELGDEGRISLFVALPFKRETWQRLRSAGDEIEAAYWMRVSPGFYRGDMDDLRLAVDQLLNAGRPVMAFKMAELDIHLLDTPRLVRLLQVLPTTKPRDENGALIAPYEIERAFTVLNERQDQTRADLAGLEFHYLDVLEQSQYGIPNLERELAAAPASVIQMLAWLYRRSDGGEDPPGLLPDAPEDRERASAKAYTLLDTMRRLPGTQDNGQIDCTALRAWILEARTMAADLGRLEVCDNWIGTLIARSFREESDWPADAVADLLEDIGNDDIASGLHVGLVNQRGAVWRTSGGDQERALAAEFEAQAEAIAWRAPFVAHVLQGVAKYYDEEAKREDRRSEINRRLRS